MGKQERPHTSQAEMMQGAYAYLAELIQEVHQVAVCVGATEVSSQLQEAYRTTVDLGGGTSASAERDLLQPVAGNSDTN